MPKIMTVLRMLAMTVMMMVMLIIKVEMIIMRMMEMLMMMVVVMMRNMLMVMVKPQNRKLRDYVLRRNLEQYLKAQTVAIKAKK